MKIKVNNKQTDNKDLVVNHNVFIAKNKVEYDGENLTKTKNSTHMNSKATIKVTGTIYTGIKAQFNNHYITILSRPTWYEYLLVALTLVGSALFGGFGLLFGLIMCFVFFALRHLYSRLWIKILVPALGAPITITLAFLFVWALKALLVLIL